MGDQEAQAQYYQAHKNDEGEWGEPERPPASPKRRLASMISVRFSPDEADMVRRAAEDADESLSHFVRKATLQRCVRHRYGAASMTGMQENVQILFNSVWTTLTDGGPEASEGSHWIPNNILVGSTTGR